VRVEYQAWSGQRGPTVVAIRLIGECPDLIALEAYEEIDNQIAASDRNAVPGIETLHVGTVIDVRDVFVERVEKLSSILPVVDGDDVENAIIVK
jgi:hypothetical protein